MLPQPQDANRPPNCCARLTLGLAALGVMLAASDARSQSQQNTTPVPQAQRPTTTTTTPTRPQYPQNTTRVPQAQRPTTTTTTQHAQAPSLRQQQLPFNGANNSSRTTNYNQAR